MRVTLKGFSRFYVKQPSQAGFTLIELIITVAIGAILLTLAAPDLSRLVQSGAADSRVEPLMEDLNAARVAAISKHESVVMCPSADGSSCCVFGCDEVWAQGWLVFTDCNKNGTRETAGNICANSSIAGEEILASRSFAANPNVTVKSEHPVFSSFTFTQAGMLNNSVDKISVDSDNYKFEILANAAGRITKTQTEGGY